MLQAYESYCETIEDKLETTYQCRLDFIWLFSEEYAALFRDLKEVGDKISDDLLAFWKLRSCGQRG